MTIDIVLIYYFGLPYSYFKFYSINEINEINDFYFGVFENIISKSNSLNTESPGWVVDRMSILCLKIYHMNEQVQRTDVNSEHLENCKNKLHTLNEQQKDLSQAFNELLENYKSGEKKMKVYRQMKMYNDSSLNPELYQKKDS